MGDLSWVWLGLAAAVGAAAVAILGRLGLGNVDPTLATTLRALVMAGVLVVVSLSTGSLGALVRGETSLDPRAWTFVLLAGLCGAGSWLAYFAALRIAPAAPVSALDRLSLPLVFVIGIFALGERPGALGWAGLGLVVLGTYLIVADPLSRPAG